MFDLIIAAEPKKLGQIHVGWRVSPIAASAETRAYENSRAIRHVPEPAESSAVASHYRRVMRVIEVAVFCVMAVLWSVGLWAVERWSSTADSRFLGYMAWDILAVVAFFGTLRISACTAMGIVGAHTLGGSNASRQSSSNVDLDEIGATLVRCENAKCPSWVTSEVGTWLEDGADDGARRRALLDRLYRYSAFSTDPYERRRAANDLRAAINPWSRRNAL